jgi:hypothetical protein
MMNLFILTQLPCYAVQTQFDRFDFYRLILRRTFLKILLPILGSLSNITYNGQNGLLNTLFYNILQISLYIISILLL